MTTTHSEMTESDTEEGVVALCFLFMALVFGSIVMYIQTWSYIPSFLKSMPYTVVVFIIGFIIGVSTISVNKTNIFIESIQIWDNLNPEMVLYIFIPALIFGEVANLNMHHLKSTAVQGILLAGPGALLGALIMALCFVNWNMLPYRVTWSSNTFLLFSSILCATDPVSVVSLLSKMELFRSQKLKYIITSEALFNDAMALVLYTIFLSGELLESSAMTAYDIFIYGVNVISISPLLGAFFGLVSLQLMMQVSRNKFSEAYEVVTIIIPICAAYLSFFVGQFVLRDSGILSCYCAGLMFCWLSPSFFRHNEAVHSVWVAIEWTSNTLIFMLAGMLIGYRSMHFYTGKDLVNIIVVYLLMFAIRGVVIMICFPLLAWLGKGCTMREAIFMTFSGLRGAISVSLSLSFSLACERGLTRVSAEEGNRFFFYVGGVTALSLIFNATFAESLLVWLGLSESSVDSSSMAIMRSYTRKRLIEAAIKPWLEIPPAHREIIVQRCDLFKELDQAWLRQQREQEQEQGQTSMKDEMSKNDVPVFLHGSSRSLFRSQSLHLDQRDDDNNYSNNTTRVEDVHHIVAPYRLNDSKKDDTVNEALMDSVRAAFLECVRAYYWTQVHKGIYKRYSYVTRTLVASVDLGLETTGTPGLQDWDYIATIIRKNSAIFGMNVVKTTYSYLQRKVPRVAKYQQRQVENVSNILTTFIAAHKHAQVKIPHYFGPTSAIDTVEQAEVVRESQELVEQANERLQKLRDPLLEYRKTKEKLLQILSKLEVMLGQCKEEAVIMNSDLHHFLDSITEERITIDILFSRKSKFKLKSKTLEEYRQSLVSSSESNDGDDHDGDDGHYKTPIKKNGSSSRIKGGLFSSFSVPKKKKNVDGHDTDDKEMGGHYSLKQPLL